jgi:hypothetical protein
MLRLRRITPLLLVAATALAAPRTAGTQNIGFT